MLTQAQLQSVLSTVRSIGLDYEAMAEAIDLALFQAHMDGTTDIAMPFLSVASDGTSITRVPIADGMKLASYFRQRASGGIVSQLIEFNRG